MRPNFSILIYHFEDWVKENKEANFSIARFDHEKVVSSLNDGYDYVRTRFLNKGHPICEQQDIAKVILEYTYQYTYIDINGLVNMESPDDTSISINEVQNQVLRMMVADGYADY